MEYIMSKTTLWFMFLVLCVEIVSAEESCYGAGVVATSVVLSVVITLLVVAAVYYWFRRRPKSEHLILETDPEKGKAEYAFDNPGFKDTTILSRPQEKSTGGTEQEKSGKQKWNNWTGLSALTSKPEKKKTVDDNSVKDQEVKVVTLKSQDFAGLGFNICGNMKEGIYIKDVLHRGPASESGKLSSGDRISSVTINFEHIVYEDALNILSSASPYEIMIEAKSGKILFGSSSKSDHPSHPMYRSSSDAHLKETLTLNKKKTLMGSNTTFVPKSLSNTTTLERKDSKSPGPTHPGKNYQNNSFRPEDLKNQLEQKINSAETEMRLKAEPTKVDVEIQKTENKHTKFGIRVFPSNVQVSPKSAEISQNDNNANIEKHVVHADIDEVDAKIQNVQSKEEFLQPKEQFNRNDVLYGSGLKRDENGIPQEIPSHMLNAAVAARRNRKSQEEILVNEDEARVLKKIKGKAPSPPNDDNIKKSVENLTFETSIQAEDTTLHIPLNNPQNSSNLIEKELEMTKDTEINSFSPDSDEETDNHSSVTTIELNSCDITIHQGGNEEKQRRKTASTGDLTKIQKTRISSSGTLERAQSLDITDSGIPNISKKTQGGTNIFEVNSDEDLFGKVMLNKEPRLSLILDGLNTFQRNRLKKSTEWGNLEDAILRSKRDEDSISPDDEQYQSLGNSSFQFEENNAEFDAVVNKINQIKKESNEIHYMEMKESNEDLEKNTSYEIGQINGSSKPKNQIWPMEPEEYINIQVNPIRTRQKSIDIPTPPIKNKDKMNVQNEIWPSELDETVSDDQQIEKNDVGITSSIYKIKTYKTKINAKSDNSKNFVDDITTTQTTVNDYLLPNKETLVSISTSQGDSKMNWENKLNKVTNTDPMIEISTRSVNETIIAETPPPELEDMEEVNKKHTNDEVRKIRSTKDSMEITNIGPTVNKIKIHKRQQIPIEDKIILLPPEITEPEIEKEMFSRVNDEYCIVRSRDKESDNFNSAASSSKGMNLEFERNSETGEICTAINNTDESKTMTDSIPKYSNDTESFIFNEKYLNTRDGSYDGLPGDTNISDDIKVSRHSFRSLERPKSDDAKSVESIKYASNVSNVTVNNFHAENGSSSLHSLELPVNDTDREAITSFSESELYTTALNESQKPENEMNKISISTPDLIKNVTITEAINTLNGDLNHVVNLEKNPKDNSKREIIINSTNYFKTTDGDNFKSSIENIPGKHSSLTYITEIQVTPTKTNTNLSEIEISQNQMSTNESADVMSENNVKNYEIKHMNVEEETEKEQDTKKQNESNRMDPERELQKIQEIAQEQFKKLPEMRFSTSSYENSVRPVEKKQSQVELLKSNFEKSPPKTFKIDGTKSRIPISTSMKTPPSTPEHREAITNADDDRELFEIISPSVHSTPMINTFKYQKPANTKNVTVTSIRSNSRIPSGLPVSGIRPPVPPKRNDQDNDSLSSTNSSISSFKQWVYNPVNSPTNFSSPGKPDNK